MAGEESSEQPQGFVIIMSTGEDRWEKNWPRIYLAGVFGDKRTKVCSPNRFEIMSAIQDALLKCRRVVLLTRAYPAINDEEALIRDMVGYYPEIEVVRMPHT